MRLPLVSAILLCVAHGLLAQTNYARDLVNPFIGTGGHGHTFPGACVPNGLVQLSPDTRTSPTEWDGCGGYHYSDSIIYGFSHTHLSGTGCADLCDVLLMPLSGRFSFDPENYASQFSHTSEAANAGYYRVKLEKPNVLAELTAAAHTGVHRYTFPEGAAPWIMLDLGHRDKLIDQSIEFSADHKQVSGKRRSSSWAKDQHLFYVIQFSRPFVEQRIDPTMTQRGDVVVQDPTKAAVRFAASNGPLIVKVGISAVSIEGARKNLEAEVPGWDFDAVRKQAEDAWNTKLSKIEVEGGTREQQRVFYTALYHCYVAPYIFNDVDGNYRGNDGQVYHTDHTVYTVFSLWDTFRALHPLMTILEPDMTNDFVKSFLDIYRQTGKLPVWELWGNETNCMIGYHSVSVIADAYMKGIRGFDADLAMKAMAASANADDPGSIAYRAKGCISSEDGSDDVSRTLEYAYDDACIARMGEDLRRLPSWDRGTAEHLDSLSRDFRQRSHNWMSLLNPATGFFQARRNGGFIPHFDPFEVNFHYTEANAWQYSVFVPQDIDGLIALHGGHAGFEAHLDKLFSASSVTSGREQPDIAGLIGQYAHGNEPSHNMAYLYNGVGKPEKTRTLAKKIMDDFYHDAPDGLIGNEDCGQMSAWYVMSALGLYQVSPGIDDRYDLGYPLFDKAMIHLPNGRSWTMMVDSRDNAAVDSTGNRDRWGTRIRHADLINGGELVFTKDRRPARSDHRTSAAPADTSGRTCPVRPGAPVIDAASATFNERLEVTVKGCGRCLVQDDRGGRVCPMNEPFTIDRTSSIQVDWSDVYGPVTAVFTKVDGTRRVDLQSTYANQYAAGGAQALVDGQRGGTDLRGAEWQGFRGQDLVASVDLGRVQKLKRAGLSVLQDQHAWIWYPAEVTIAWSMNGRQWSSIVVENTIDRKADGGMKQELWSPFIGKKARYVKVIATNAGPCPDWHPGKGGSSWIFADEILTEAEQIR